MGRWTTVQGSQAGEVGTLACGTYSWGVRHIWFGNPAKGQAGHETEWNEWGAEIGDDGFDAMVWSVTQVIRYPASAAGPQANDTYTYKAPIQLKDKNGRVLMTINVTAPVSRVDRNVITAYY